MSNINAFEFESFNFELAQELYNSSSEFPIDFELAWKWLGYSKKGNAKRILVKNFVENEDFRVLRVQQSAPQGGLTHREDIWLTTNCLKEMGMITGTEQGKTIRKYFLQCEAIAKQAVGIISTIQETITQLLEENKQLRLLVTQNQQAIANQNNAIALTTKSIAQLESKIEPLLPPDPNQPAPGWTQESWDNLPPQDKRHFRFLYKKRRFQPSDQGEEVKALPSVEMQEYRRMQKAELDAIVDIANIPAEELAAVEERKRKLLEEFRKTEE